MKRITSFLMVAMLLITQALAVETVITKDKEFRIDLVRVDPTPLEPGKMATLHFDLTVLGDETKNVAISFVDEYPFTSINKEISLEGLMKGSRVPFQFEVEIAPGISLGSYKVSLQYFSEKIKSTISESFNVAVKDISPVLKTVSFTSIPEALEPGKPAKLMLTVENTAGSKIKDVSLKMTLENSSIPFAPLLGGAERRIKEIAINQRETVIVDILVQPDAKVGVYKIPLKLEYSDDLGTKTQLNDLLAVVVDAPVQLTALLDDDNTLKINEKGKITVSISNRGLNDVKFLAVTLLEKSGYKILSNSMVYIGNLESDDYDTADFSIFPEEKTTASIVLNYKDTFNNDYEETFEMPLPLYSASEAKRYGLEKGSNIPSIIISLIFLVAAISFMRKWYQKKSFTKALVLFVVSFALGIFELFRLLRPVHLRNRLKELLKEKGKDDQ